MMSEKEPIRIELPTKFEMGTVSDESWSALINGLSDAGLAITDIERIIITHAHVDHMGMAAKVAEASGASVWVSDMVRPWAIDLSKVQAERWDTIMRLLTEITNQEDSPMHQGFAKFFNNYKEYWDPIPEEALEVFQVGDMLSLGDGQWEVKYAPGHCINQTCFYNSATKELLAADMLLRIASTPVVDADLIDPQKRAEGLSVMMKTMKEFMSLELSTVYPGHYEPISNGNELLRKQLDRIDQRIQQTYQLITEGQKSFFEILQHMYKGRVSGPAIPMMIGYLDVLLAKNMITSSQSEGGLIYSISAN